MVPVQPEMLCLFNNQNYTKAIQEVLRAHLEHNHLG